MSTGSGRPSSPRTTQTSLAQLCRQQANVTVRSHLSTLPEPLRSAALAPREDIHRDKLPDPAPLAAELYEIEARINPELSERSVSRSGRFKAAAYANRYWTNYNSAYRRCDGSGQGGGCTNFVSQCMSGTGMRVHRKPDMEERRQVMVLPPVASVHFCIIGQCRKIPIICLGQQTVPARIALLRHVARKRRSVWIWERSVSFHDHHGKKWKATTPHLPQQNVHNKPFFALKKSVDSESKKKSLRWTIWVLNLT